MLLKTISTFAIPLLVITSSAQMREPIHWSFDYAIVNPSLVTVRATATLAPGWHIYSQFLDDGGPAPTKLLLTTDNEIQRMGLAEEKGIPVRFFDTLYDMDIVWYANDVTFLQPIQIGHSPIDVKGSLSYMTCNDHLCIPGSCSFSLPVKTTRRAP